MSDTDFQRFEESLNVPVPTAQPRTKHKPGKMPFGKYAGRPVDNCPKDYLQWLLKKLDRDDWLHQEITATLDRWNAQRTPKAKRGGKR